MKFSLKFRLKTMMRIHEEKQKNATVYKIDTIDVDGKPEVQFKCLKRLVGERRFEPPTPWSRTRFRLLLNPIDLCRSQAFAVERFVAKRWAFVELD
jgi:hypothetical protein